MIISSFSGGRTSAFMTIKLKEIYGDDLNVVFMNTGFEHEETLLFVNKCDNFFNLNIDWIEAKVQHGERKGSTFKYTTYEKATRGNDIAKEVVLKYGLYGVGFLHCTREMKLNPFKNWKKSKGLCSAQTAVGIRADEADRISSRFKEDKLFYPLIKMGITKGDILDFWSKQPFDLEIPEHLGNCINCWKKTDRKLKLACAEFPEYFEMIKELESSTSKGSDKMFRKNRCVSDILKGTFSDDGSYENSCKESCELF